MNIYKESGFTLIELLVVVTIIGILASLGVANFIEYKARAYDAVAKSDIKNFEKALFGFLSENPLQSNLTTSDLSIFFTPSDGVIVSAFDNTNDEEYFIGLYHEKGSSCFCILNFGGNDASELITFSPSSGETAGSACGAILTSNCEI